MCRQKTQPQRNAQPQGMEREYREHSQNLRITRQQDKTEREQVQ